MFGGKKSESVITNDLWILKLGKKPLEWVKQEVKGRYPCPRYSHTMNYYEAANFIIIHGGRNDFSDESFALNDTFILELSKLEWAEIKLYSDVSSFNVFNRCGHAAVIYCKILSIILKLKPINC